MSSISKNKVSLYGTVISLYTLPLCDYKIFAAVEWNKLMSLKAAHSSTIETIWSPYCKNFSTFRKFLETHRGATYDFQFSMNSYINQETEEAWRLISSETHSHGNSPLEVDKFSSSSDRQSCSERSKMRADLSEQILITELISLNSSLERADLFWTVLSEKKWAASTVQLPELINWTQKGSYNFSGSLKLYPRRYPVSS